MVPTIPDEAGDITSGRSPSSVNSSLNKRTFNQGLEHVAEPALGGEKESLQYLQPDTEHDCSSEHSYSSQKSCDAISFGKTFQTQSNQRRPDSISHRSTGSHRSSFKSSCANSRVSKSSMSYAGSFESFSEIISDRAESVGSVGSRNSEHGRMVIVGHAGSEKKAHLGRGTLGQIGTLASQSDFESF